MDTLLQDLRYAVRMLRRSPGFTIAAVLTLALAIGPNAALFTVVNAVILRPLPYPDADRLMVLWHQNRQATGGSGKEPVSHHTMQDFASARSFEQVGGVSPTWSFFVRTSEGREVVSGLFATPSMLALAGVTPVQGRLLQPADDQAGAPLVAMVSQRMWQRLYGDGARLNGQAIETDGGFATIVGIVPDGFRLAIPLFSQSAPDAGTPPEMDVWVPLAQNPLLLRAGGPDRVRFVTVIGRLRAGASIEQVRTEIATIAARAQQERPEFNAGLDGLVFPLQDEVVGPVRGALLIMAAAVGFVLLIACANVANLLLGRAGVRGGEMALRAAIGASRGRLGRQLLTESALLALAGGVAGFAIAAWGVAALARLAPPGVPRLHEISVDGTVLLYAVLLTLVTGVLFGVMPALHATRADLQPALKEGGRTSRGGSGRARRALVISETAIAVILLVGAGLLVRSFAQLLGVDPGFGVERVLTAQVALPVSVTSSDVPTRAVFYEDMFRRVGEIPGVEVVGASTRIPFRGGVTTSLEIEGRPMAPGERLETEFRRASPDYFASLSIPVLDGRPFRETDRADQPLVAVVNDAAARLFWPDGEPVGARVRFFGSPDDPWFTVVGVVGDVRHFGLDAAPRPEVYMPFSQGPPGSPLLTVRTTRDPASLVPEVRRALRELNPAIAMYNVATMNSLRDESVAPRKFTMLLLGWFAALALGLAAVGTYGVMSYMVSQRREEIGIRMALGAERRDVLQLIVGHGMKVTGIGLGLGIVGAVLLTGFMSGLLFGVRPLDPATLVTTVLTLGIVAAVACYLPARRAAGVDPIVVLRSE
jgi:predicted permease